MIRPSSLPMLAACPCFESGPTEWTEGGTNRHRYLHLLWLMQDYSPSDDPKGYRVEALALKEKMDDEEIEACEWAYDYIKMTASLNDRPIYFERKMSFTLADFSEMEGTPDVTCGIDLFDLKWRERDYHAQMAAYACMMFEAAINAGKPLPYVRVHIMFGAFKKVETVYTLSHEEAMRIVEYVIANTKESPFSGPAPMTCEYCGWCKNNLTCPAIVNQVKTVAVGYSDAKPPEITSWHPSQMETAEQFAFALSVWRNCLKKWGERIEYHALEAAYMKGMVLPGFELVETKGKKIILDVAQAMAISQFSQTEILECCQVRLNTSKDYPDRKGMNEIWKSKGKYTSKKAAEKALLELLAPVIQTGKDGWKLKSVKQTDEND